VLARHLPPFPTRRSSDPCETWHGKTGHGNGPTAAALNPKPRDFTAPTNFKSKNDDEMFAVISKGGASRKLSPLMPAWGTTLKKRSEEHTSELQSPDHLVC